MMEYEDRLLTHYQNLRNLVSEQREAAEKGQSERLTAIVEQKQIIINAIETSEKDIEVMSVQTRAAIRKYIREIMVIEEETWQNLQKIKNAIREEIVLMRTENRLNEKYTPYLEQAYFFDKSR